MPETGYHTVEANGLTHAYFDDGEGPLLILQHGFPDTAHSWDEFVTPLVAAGYRVVRPFGRGIAPSERPTHDDYAVTDLANDLLALITALGAERATLVGHDWGAAAAWGAAHLEPARVEKLVVVAIPHPNALRPTPAKVWGVRHFVANRLPRAEARFRRDDFAEIRTMYERWSPGFDWPDSEFEAAKNAYAHPGTADAALGYYRRAGLWPFRGKVAVETLVIGGESDGVATRDDFERSSRHVSARCTVKMLPGGHFLHREHPEPFLATLLEALTR